MQEGAVFWASGLRGEINWTRKTFPTDPGTMFLPEGLQHRVHR